MPKLLDKTKIYGPRKSKNRQTKVNLIFDEQARKDFLLGFRKRKAERRLKYQEKLKQELKEEKKRLRQQLRAKIEKSASHQRIPEIEHLVEPEELDFPEHTVTVSEISGSALQEDNLFLGNNTAPRTVEESDKEDEDSDDGSESSQNESENVPKDKKKVAKEVNKKMLKKLQKTDAFKKHANINRMKCKKIASRARRNRENKKKGRA